MKLKNLLFSFLVITAFQRSTAQPCKHAIKEQGGSCSIKFNDATDPCITPDQYETMFKRCRENARLYRDAIQLQKSNSTVLFNWPLQMANGLNNCNNYVIGNFVDQGLGSGNYNDYNCGYITYDTHHGTDIAAWPYPFLKMDSNMVEVIAAAPGIIVDKVDGNFDKNCGISSTAPNYIMIQHTDGSVALYEHLKKFSLTSKVIGQTVTTGEYLGIAGSSGNSTLPHLHFEVRADTNFTVLVDPFSGPCNLMNTSSWWAVQKPYPEPTILSVSTNTAAPVMPACPVTETPNETGCFTGAGMGIFTIFLLFETDSTSVNLRILNPNGSVFSSWVHNCTVDYFWSYWYWNQPLPTVSGTYTFEAVYNGDTCSKQFEINCASGIAEEFAQAHFFEITPNPNDGNFTILFQKAITKGAIEIVNIPGENIFTENILNESKKEINLKSISRGIYFVKVFNGEKYDCKKLIIEHD